jgi:hypothetical protein
MKPFKFFTGEVKKYVQYNTPNDIFIPQRRYMGRRYMGRRYMGIERGIINWINQPIAMVYYVEPRMSTDPINEDSIPVIDMRLHTQLITVNDTNYMSFERFMEINSEKYIFVYTVDERNGTRHTNENTIPLGVPLSIRTAILD